MSLRSQILYSLHEHSRVSLGVLSAAQVEELMAAASEYIYSGQASRDLIDPKAAVRHVVLDLLADPDSPPPSTDEVLVALRAALEHKPAVEQPPTQAAASAGEVAGNQGGGEPDKLSEVDAETLLGRTAESPGSEGEAVPETARPTESS